MEDQNSLKLDQKTMDVLVANIIPTSKYFEVRFDHMQGQITELRNGQKELQKDISKLDEKLDRKIDFLKNGVDKKFSEFKLDIDTKFEQVDKRFISIENKLDLLLDKVDTKIDSGLRESRLISIRLFSFAMIFSAISMAGMLGKILGIF